MNETASPETPETDPEADDALKRRLLNRIAVATVVMLALLGSLALFDAIYAPEPPPTPVKVAAAPPKIEAPKAIEPAKPEPAAVAEPAAAAAVPGTAPGTEAQPGAVAKADTAAAKVDVKTVPEATSSPAAPPLLPLPAEKPLTRPATSRPVSVRPAEAVPPAASPAARPDPARELAPTPAVARRAPASRPLTQAAERQYALQMGVFGNLANAEDLRAKLELNGIPSTIEARVHAGPFKTREEVELARAKLKELGLDGILISLRK